MSQSIDQLPNHTEAVPHATLSAADRVASFIPFRQRHRLLSSLAVMAMPFSVSALANGCEPAPEKQVTLIGGDSIATQTFIPEADAVVHAEGLDADNLVLTYGGMGYPENSTVYPGYTSVDGKRIIEQTEAEDDQTIRIFVGGFITNDIHPTNYYYGTDGFTPTDEANLEAMANAAPDSACVALIDAVAPWPAEVEAGNATLQRIVDERAAAGNPTVRVRWADYVTEGVLGSDEYHLAAEDPTATPVAPELYTPVAEIAVQARTAAYQAGIDACEALLAEPSSSELAMTVTVDQN